jgi:hypothetical protein
MNILVQAEFKISNRLNNGDITKIGLRPKYSTGLKLDGLQPKIYFFRLKPGPID